MSNANKIARYITTIDTAPSSSVNIFVVKPMTVTTTSFFFFHITDVLSLPNTSILRIDMSDIYNKDFSLLK